jgi:hypothetical protein
LVELEFPKRAIAFDPFQRGSHWRRGESRSSCAAVATDGCEAGAFEDADVFRDGRERHVEPRGELADRLVARGQTGKDLAPRWVGQRGEGRVELRGMVNHMV